MLYDALAEHYHLLFEDWQRSLVKQGEIISALIPPPEACGKVLDCACGIGTQAIGLALRGYDVEGSDVSLLEVQRARRESASRGLSIPFRRDDMRSLAGSSQGQFGCVLALDNAIPHLDSDEDIVMALSAMRRRLRPGGTLLLSIRDYGPLIAARSKSTEPMIFSDGGRRRIVHQVWDWQDDRRYALHIFVTQELDDGAWTSRHFVGGYRAVTVDELADLTERGGLRKVEVLGQAESGFYQPMIRAIA